VHKAKYVSAVAAGHIQTGISIGLAGSLGRLMGRPRFTNEAAKEAHPWSKVHSATSEDCPDPCVNIVDHGGEGTREGRGDV